MEALSIIFKRFAMKPFSSPYEFTANERQFWSVLGGMLQSGKAVRFNPKGTSMGPFIRPGDTVTVKPCSFRDLKLGDIVLFRSGREAYRMHRIVEIARDNGRRIIVTRGDACMDPDPPIQQKDILGKVSAIRKRRWTLALDRPGGKALNLTWAYLLNYSLSSRLLRRAARPAYHFARSLMVRSPGTVRI